MLLIDEFENNEGTWNLVLTCFQKSACAYPKSLCLHTKIQDLTKASKNKYTRRNSMMASSLWSSLLKCEVPSSSIQQSWELKVLGW